MTKEDLINANVQEAKVSILKHFSTKECEIDISTFYKMSDSVSEELYKQWLRKKDKGEVIELKMPKSSILPGILTYDTNIALLLNHKDDILKPLEYGPEPFLRLKHFQTAFYIGLHSGYLSSMNEDEITDNVFVKPNKKDRIEYFKTIYSSKEIVTNIGNFNGSKFVKKITPKICSPVTLFWLGYYTAKTWCIEDVAKLKPQAFKGILEVQNNIERMATPFSVFFDNKLNEGSLKLIKENFKNQKGKTLAALIFILQSEMKILNVTENSKTHSRKHFVDALIEKDSTRYMSGINKHFDTVSRNFNSDLKNDDTLILIRQKLEKLNIKSVV